MGSLGRADSRSTRRSPRQVSGSRFPESEAQPGGRYGEKPRACPHRDRHRNKKENRWHPQSKPHWVVQYKFYINVRRWGLMFVRMCLYLPFSARDCLN